MSLRLSHSILLPVSAKPGGFGSAALHRASGKLFVAHAANDAVDVIDTIFGVYLYSVPELRGVTAVIVGEELNEVFATNTNENKIGFFQVADSSAEKMVVGRRPSALAWDPRRGTLWVGNAGHPTHLADCTVSVVDFVTRTRVVATLALPGRPRAMLYDDAADALYVGIDAPACVVVVAGSAPSDAAAIWPLPAGGVRSLVKDSVTGRLLCACEDNATVALDASTGMVKASAPLSGEPGEMALDPDLRRLYVAGVAAGALEVLDADSLKVLDAVETEEGAKTLYLDAAANTLYVFCPHSSRALVFKDS